MSKRFGLLGEHTAHSYSPRIHSYLGDYRYELYSVPPDELDGFLKRGDFDGLNVTVPYKQAVIPYCSALSAEVSAIGSVNTIIKDSNGLLRGHNTDCIGFRHMAELSAVDFGGKKVLVLGDGGAACAVRYVLGSLNCKDIVTISRRGDDNYGNIHRHYDADIIVNTTPVGMYPDNGSTPLSLDGFTGLCAVLDLIYNPARTELMLEAERRGIQSFGGLTMLVGQAVAASRLFTDTETVSYSGQTQEITDKLRKEMQNIALIGMPGCGKSTAGKMLAEILQRPFIDIDEQIESHVGKPIPEIFRNDGEDAFRNIETHVLGRECMKSGCVIATGGGVVTRPGNFRLLRQNSMIVYLKREPDKLSTAGRPLSTSLGVEALAAVRIPLYESWCDNIVETQDDSTLTVKAIIRELGLPG